MANALLVVPPLIKYSSGPLLGPALLQSAARKGRHKCSLIDLNALFLKPRVTKRSHHGVFLGDHDKPNRLSPNSLNKIEEDFLNYIVLPGVDNISKARHRVQFGFLEHHEVTFAATTLKDSSTFGSWVRAEMLRRHRTSTPDLVGVSLLHAGQVVPAVAVSMIARDLWPGALIVWGGPHISGIKDALAHDLQCRHFAADVFVTGHAERTFRTILDKLAIGEMNSDDGAVHLFDGEGEWAVSPVFEELGVYDKPLTLPAQSTLGCAYGRCAFCTYPAIEPVTRKLPTMTSVGTVVDLAEKLGATIAIKDSLATTLRLQELGSCISGRALWSACTKISSRLDTEALSGLHLQGLRTLEVGLESLLPETQHRVRKLQPKALYEDFIRGACMVPDLSIVVNYMTGFPWEDETTALEGLREAKQVLQSYLGDGGLVEHNTFELERLSPLT